MRRIRYGVAASLDGFIAGPNGEYDWIVMDPGFDFAALWSQFDTLLMGRKTFEVATGGTGPSMGDMRVVVVSRTLKPADHPKVTIISDDLDRRVRDLRAESGKDIWLFGGGQLFRSLLDFGLVDRVDVAVMPVLLGQGIPLLPPGSRATLTLKKQRVFEKTGTVSLEYDVKKTRKHTKSRP